MSKKSIRLKLEIISGLVQLVRQPNIKKSLSSTLGVVIAECEERDKEIRELKDQLANKTEENKKLIRSVKLLGKLKV